MLNVIVLYDWVMFFNICLIEMGQFVLINGFVMNGYKLVYGFEQSGMLKQVEKICGIDVSYLLGMVINKEGVVIFLVWNSFVFKVGIDVGIEIEVVNVEVYLFECIKVVILVVKGSKDLICLIVKNGDCFCDLMIDYYDGFCYLCLQKVGIGDGGFDLFFKLC